MEKLIERQKIEERFKEYTKDYDLADPKIRLKYDHTFRVAALCEQIAQSIHLSEHACTLAWLMGMLHDIGRFEQVRRYGTFSDDKSIDHAMFGADLLFREGLFDEYIKEPCAEDRVLHEVYINIKRLTETGIRNHSAYRIEKGLSGNEQMFCHILRDADKIDILRVNCDTPMEQIYNVTTQELRQSAVSPQVKAAFMEHHAVLRAYKKTAIDNAVGHVSLVFELVFPISRQIVKEQGYLDRMLAFSSENEETQSWFQYMKEHIWDE